MMTRSQLDLTAAAMRLAGTTKGTGCKAIAKAIEEREDPNAAGGKYLLEHAWKHAGWRDNWTLWSKDGHAFPQHFALWLERNNVNECWW